MERAVVVPLAGAVVAVSFLSGLLSAYRRSRRGPATARTRAAYRRGARLAFRPALVVFATFVLLDLYLQSLVVGRATGIPLVWRILSGVTVFLAVAVAGSTAAGSVVGVYITGVGPS